MRNFLQIVRFCLLANLLLGSVRLMAESEIPDWMVRSALRICSERREGSELVTGHGTAFGINLSKYGYTEPRYLLSAGHNVRDPQGNFYPAVRIEMRCLDGMRWFPCRVMAVDPVLDICLLETGIDMPYTACLAEREPDVGSQLVLVGSPRGISPTPYRGCVTEKSYGARDLTEFQVTQFDHGCSGGPVFDSATERVVGVAIAGVGHDDVMDPNIGLFTPLAGINRFLQERLTPRPLPQVAQARNYGSFLEPVSIALPVAAANVKTVVKVRDGVFIDPNKGKTPSVIKRATSNEYVKSIAGVTKKTQITKPVLAEVVSLDKPAPHKAVALAKPKRQVPTPAASSQNQKEKIVRVRIPPAAPAPSSTNDPKIIAASSKTATKDDSYSNQSAFAP